MPEDIRTLTDINAVRDILNGNETTHLIRGGYEVAFNSIWKQTRIQLNRPRLSTYFGIQLCQRVAYRPVLEYLRHLGSTIAYNQLHRIRHGNGPIFMGTTHMTDAGMIFGHVHNFQRQLQDGEHQPAPCVYFGFSHMFNTAQFIMQTGEHALSQSTNEIIAEILGI